MESPTDKLLQKYWAGETSLEEERKIKAHFRNNPLQTAEGSYFGALDTLRQESSGNFHHPEKKNRRAQWSIASTVTIGIIAAALVFLEARHQQKFAVEDPKEAYEITRKALLMVSSGINQGQIYSQEINHINKAEMIIRMDDSSSAN